MKERGFSLIELLFSGATGIILFFIFLSAFTRSQSARELQRAFSEVQENAYFTSFYLRKSIEIAGLVGCGQLGKHFPVYNRGVDSFKELSEGNFIQIYSKKDFKQKNIDPKQDTDIIIVRNMDPLTASLKGQWGKNKLAVSKAIKFKCNDDLLFSDCRHAELFQVVKVNWHRGLQVLTLSDNIKEDYSDYVEVGKLMNVVFFIQETKRKNKKGEKIEALYRLDSNGRKEELVAGITSLKAALVKKEGKRKAINIRLRVCSTNGLKYCKERSFCKSAIIYIPLRERESS